MRFIKLPPPAKRCASCFHYAISRDIRHIFLVVRRRRRRRVVFNEGKVDTHRFPWHFSSRLLLRLLIHRYRYDGDFPFFSLPPPFNLPHALIYFLIGFPPRGGSGGKLVCSIANSEITNVHHLTRWINQLKTSHVFRVWFHRWRIFISRR